jgi:drug/metabolite transporter (DMT)-like permease
VRETLAVLAAVATATLYALSTSLQALEARRAPADEALRASLIRRLLRRPLWLAGTACGLLAWPLQAVALALGSVALVQPALGFGLVVLLALGVAILHERIGVREVAGVLAIAAAVALLAWAAPAETGSFTTGGTWVVGLTVLAVAPSPYLLRALRRAGGLPTSVAAGLGWAWVALCTSLLDEALAERRWLAFVGWGAAVLVTSWGALLDEMTSLQTWAATRAIPVAFCLEMLLPAALGPLLAHAEPRDAPLYALALVLAGGGAVAVGSSRAVAKAAQPS